MTTSDEMAAPELQLLTDVLGDEDAAHALATAPGGWRDLNRDELRALGLGDDQVRAVNALQTLVVGSWPSVPREKLLAAEEIARVYTPRLGAEKDEIVVALALDGDGYFLQEIEVGKNTGDGFGLAPPNVLRPMIRAGAEACFVVINAPSGKPRATPDLVVCAQRLEAAGEAVGIRLVDVVVVGAREHGWMSLAEQGLIER